MTLHVRDHGPHIAIITMDNQAKANALSRDDLRDLGDLWLRLQDGPHRCLILTGAGEKSFCAGADLSGDLSAGGIESPSHPPQTTPPAHRSPSS